LPFVGRIERLTGAFEFGGVVETGVTPASAAAMQTASPAGAEASVYVDGTTGDAEGSASGTLEALAAVARAATAAHVSGVATGAGEELPPPQPAAASRAHPPRTAEIVSGERFTFEPHPKEARRRERGYLA
jgi:hypothetical protein